MAAAAAPAAAAAAAPARSGVPTKSGISSAIDAAQKKAVENTREVLNSGERKYVGEMFRHAEHEIRNLKFDPNFPLCRLRNSIRWVHIVRPGVEQSGQILTPVWNAFIEERDLKTGALTGYRIPAGQTQTITNPSGKLPLVQAAIIFPPTIPSMSIIEPAGTWLGATGTRRAKIEERQKNKGSKHVLYQATMEKAQNVVIVDGHAHDEKNAIVTHVKADGKPVLIDKAMYEAFEKCEQYLNHSIGYVIAASTEPDKFERDQKAEHPLMDATLKWLGEPDGLALVEAKEKELAELPAVKAYIKQRLEANPGLKPAVETDRLLNQAARVRVGVKYFRDTGEGLGEASGMKIMIAPCTNQVTGKPEPGTRSLFINQKRYTKLHADKAQKDLKTQKDRLEQNDKRTAAAAKAAAKRKAAGASGRGSVAALVAAKQKAAAAEDAARNAARQHQEECRDTFEDDFAKNHSGYSDYDREAYKQGMTIKKPDFRKVVVDTLTGKLRHESITSSALAQQLFNTRDALTVYRVVIEFYTESAKFKYGHKAALRGALHIPCVPENIRKFDSDSFDVGGVDAEYSGVMDAALQKKIARGLMDDGDDEEVAAADSATAAPTGGVDEKAPAAAAAAAPDPRDPLGLLGSSGQKVPADAPPPSAPPAAAAAAAAAPTPAGSPSKKRTGDTGKETPPAKRARGTAAATPAAPPPPVKPMRGKGRAAAAAAAAGADDDDDDADLLDQLE